jgi:hypothetical protein
MSEAWSPEELQRLDAPTPETTRAAERAARSAQTAATGPTPADSPPS